ncbi:hypothetical protein QE152_g29092 [Popillia japonica]|uniref:Uncharacterized protein n=1 Tax=Popillia japonica TaxID=7064 RepID=A0AAW1JIM7_POPJA
MGYKAIKRFAIRHTIIAVVTVTTSSLDNAIDENTKELRDLPSGILSSQSSNSNESQYSIVNLEGVSDHLFPDGLDTFPKQSSIGRAILQSGIKNESNRTKIANLITDYLINKYTDRVPQNAFLKAAEAKEETFNGAASTSERILKSRRS